MMLRESLIAVHTREYEKMLEESQDLEGLKLVLHRERMKVLQEYLQSLRSLVSNTLSPHP